MSFHLNHSYSAWYWTFHSLKNYSVVVDFEYRIKVHHLFNNNNNNKRKTRNTEDNHDFLFSYGIYMYTFVCLGFVEVEIFRFQHVIIVSNKQVGLTIFTICFVLFCLLVFCLFVFCLFVFCLFVFCLFVFCLFCFSWYILMIQFSAKYRFSLPICAFYRKTT